MIQAFVFTNQYGRSLRCTLSEPELSRFAVKSVTGLGPDRANVNVNEYAMADGGYFGSARFPSRTLTFNFAFLDYDETGAYVPIEETRQVSYAFFQPKTPVRVTVITDVKELFIDGIIEGNEPDIFSSQEGCIVSIRCPGYYFKMASATGTERTALLYGKGLFEFPFSNETPRGEETIEYNNTIEFGVVSAGFIVDVDNPGDASTGCTIDISFTGEAVGVINIEREALGTGSVGSSEQVASEQIPRSITNAQPVSQRIVINVAEMKQEIMYWETNGPRYGTVFTEDSLQAFIYGTKTGNSCVYAKGNKIHISSITGEKNAVFVKGKKKTNILGVFREFVWLTLQPGKNRFYVSTDWGFEGKFNVTLKYEPKFSGV